MLDRRDGDREADPGEDQRRDHLPISDLRLGDQAIQAVPAACNDSQPAMIGRSPRRRMSLPASSGTPKTAAPHGISRSPAESGP